MGDGGGIDHSVELQPDPGAAEIVEEANAVAEQQRDEVDLELVEQSGPQILLNGLGAARY